MHVQCLRCWRWIYPSEGCKDCAIAIPVQPYYAKLASNASAPERPAEAQQTLPKPPTAAPGSAPKTSEGWDQVAAILQLEKVYAPHRERFTAALRKWVMTRTLNEPIAIMDGRYITEMRTAAVSAVATDLLARKNVDVLAILGSGVQARSHFEALTLVRQFKEIRVWSPNNAKRFAAEHNIIAAESAESAVRDADVIAVVTGAKLPVIFGEWVSPGAHINAVGANRPTWRELDDDILRKSRIYVESRESALVESGDLIAAGTIFAEIGEVVSGVKPARQSNNEITLFKSLGTAVEDIAAADLVYRKLARV